MLKISRKIQIISIAILLCLCVPLTTGCSKTKIVLTTGFEAGEVFKIDTAVCTRAEIMVYLVNLQNSYEEVYGEEIWKTSYDGVTLEEKIKDTVLARIARVKVMNLMAAQNTVELSDNEEELVKKAGHEYYVSLNDQEKAVLGVTEDMIINLYHEYALANKVYDYLIQDVNPEISDDEARTITVQHILIKTYRVDANGQRTEFSTAAKEEAYGRAKSILTLARAEGADFDQLIREYNEDTISEYSFHKGEVDYAYETAAFNLGNNEISDIVETEYGYHIIRCISTFNRDETDLNKEKIVAERKNEAFTAEYEAFLANLTKNINTKEWEKVAMVHDPMVKTTTFFSTYEDKFKQ